MSTTKTPQVGQSILFFANSDDSIALSNGKRMGDPVAAIITQVWGPVMVNLKLIPDHAAMQDRGSVGHKSLMPGGGGYYWMFPEEFYGKQAEGGEEIPAGTFDSSQEFRPWNRSDLMSPSEKLILDAVFEIEKIGADVKLTNAQTKLKEAAMLVYEFYKEQYEKK